MPIQCVCLNAACGKIFFSKPAILAKGLGKYCSRLCYRSNKPLVEQFWDRVQLCEHGVDCIFCCHMWQGTKTKAGYGTIPVLVNGKWTTALANRLAWEFLNQRVLPPDRLACHHCDIPGCANGMHIYSGTYLTNMRDASIRNRIARGESKRGTKLRAIDIPRIFSLREQGMTYDAIAKEFGVEDVTIGDVLSYRTWMHVSKTLGEHAIEEKRYNSKLTEAKVLLIRQRYANGEMQKAIAKDFGINQANISMIVNRKTWTHIP